MMSTYITVVALRGWRYVLVSLRLKDLTYQGVLGLLVGPLGRFVPGDQVLLEAPVYLEFHLSLVAQADQEMLPSLLASVRGTCSSPFSLGRAQIQ